MWIKWAVNLLQKLVLRPFFKLNSDCCFLQSSLRAFSHSNMIVSFFSNINVTQGSLSADNLCHFPLSLLLLTEAYQWLEPDSHFTTGPETESWKHWRKQKKLNSNLKHPSIAGFTTRLHFLSFIYLSKSYWMEASSCYICFRSVRFYALGFYLKCDYKFIDNHFVITTEPLNCNWIMKYVKFPLFSKNHKKPWFLAWFHQNLSSSWTPVCAGGALKHYG